MDTVTKRLYEGMFLIDSSIATADWEGVNAFIEKVLNRNSAEVVSMGKWDERKLAYEVAGLSRGTYILTYFNADPSQITSIERDTQLSEKIMRVMILRTDRMSAEDISRDTPVKIAEKKVAEATAKAAEAAKAAEEAEKAKAAEAKVAEETAAAAAEETAEPEKPELQDELEVEQAPPEESTEDKE